jgi:hypothetical protein
LRYLFAHAEDGGRVTIVLRTCRTLFEDPVHRHINLVQCSRYGVCPPLGLREYQSAQWAIFMCPNNIGHAEHEKKKKGNGECRTLRWTQRRNLLENGACAWQRSSLRSDWGAQTTVMWKTDEKPRASCHDYSETYVVKLVYCLERHRTQWSANIDGWMRENKPFICKKENTCDANGV